MPQRSCARLHHQSAIRGERLAKERLRCHGLDASVEWWARRQRCSLRCGGLGVRTQPLPLPRADRTAAALVPSTSHGAARIMIELRNKHTLTGKLCCFQIVLCAQLGGDFLSQSLTSKGLCRRIHFRRMPSVNDGPSDMPDSGFAATSLLAGSPTSRIGLVFCSFSRLALGLDLLRSFAFCLCGSLHLRDPGSFSLCLLGRFALDLAGFSLCLLGRFALDLAGGFTLRLLRRLALRAFGSLDLRFLSGFALCLPRRLALGFSRSVALGLLGNFTLRSLDGIEPRLLCCLALRLLRGFAPGFLRGGKPCSLGRGFATRGLSPGLFSKRVELCGPVVCLLDRSRTVGGIELCLLCSGLELHHLLPCRICVRTTLLRGAFFLRSGRFVFLADRVFLGFAPVLRRGGKPCSLGCGFATRGLSPRLFSKRVELCSPVVCLLDRSRTYSGIALCLLCSGLELRHLLPCRICVRTTLLRGAF